MISIRTLIVSGLIIALVLMGGTIFLTLQNSANLSREIKARVGDLTDGTTAIAEICALSLSQYQYAQSGADSGITSANDEFIRLSSVANQRLHVLAESDLRPEELELLALIRDDYRAFERSAFHLLRRSGSAANGDASAMDREVDRLLRTFTDRMMELSGRIMQRGRALTASLADELSGDNSLIGAFVFVTLFGFLFFLLVINNAVLRPATQLIEATQRVSSGDLRFSLEVRAGSEIGILVRSFNQMVNRLAANQDEILGKSRQLQELNAEMARFNAELENKVSERSAQLLEYQEFLRRIIYGSPVSIAIFTREGLLEDCNDSFLRIAGAESRQQCIGSARLGEGPVFSDPIVTEAFRMALRGHATRTEPMAREVGGRTFWYIHHIEPLENLGGEVVKVLCYSADVTEERAARESAQIKNGELESFVYSISHDLKSPLFSIGGLLRLLETGQEELGGTTRQDLIVRIQNNVLAMEQMIGDLLELSRAGANREKFTTFDPTDLVRMIFLEEKVQRGVREIDFSLGGMESVHADLRLVGQLFRNLIGNAIKYRDQERPLKISVSGKREGGMVRYEVADNGLGIAADVIPKIFDVFFRLAPEGVDGSGVGLAIVKKVVESHGGQITVRSTPGEGTVFSFTLPAAA